MKVKGLLLRPKSWSGENIGVLQQMKTFLGHPVEFQRENLRALSKTTWMYDGVMKLHPWTTACTPWSLRTPRQAWWNENDEWGKGQAPEQVKATQRLIGVSPAQSSLEPVLPPRWAWSVRCQKDRPSKRDYLCLYLYLYLMNAMLKATTCSLTAPYEDRRDIVRGCSAQL